jgi:hypothetical protein
MRNIKYILIATVFGLTSYSCTEDVLDDINFDKDNPVDVPISTILPVVQTGTAYSVVGGDASLYMAVHTQLVTGVHAQLHAFDRLVYSNQTFQNTWSSAYTTNLKNLKIIMDKARESGANSYLGIAQLLWAYNVGILTDSWGRVPYSEAADGQSFKPAYDMQEDIYTSPNGIIALCDSAIANLAKTSSASPSSDDFIYGGDLSLWTKAAHGMKAKFITRLSNTNAYNAQAVIDAVGQSFADNSEALIFTSFSGANATSEHPWFQEENDRTHFAASQSLFNRMTNKNDPRVAIYFDDGVATVPAPNGTAQLDQGGDLYTKMYDYVDADSPLEFITFDQLKFYEAQAQLSLGNFPAANTAYVEGINAVMSRYGVAATSTATYVAQGSVNPGGAALTNDLIAEQIYLSMYPFQSIEAFAEIRRNDFPVITNPNGDLLKRLPWAQNSLDFNAENNPNTPVTNGVWWDDLTDD